MSRQNKPLICALFLAALMWRADADGCLAYSGDKGQYWMICTPQSLSGAQSQCQAITLPLAKIDDDPAFNFSAVLHDLKYKSSMPKQVEEYFKIFATSYSARLNHWFTILDQLKDHIVSTYVQATQDAIAFFNSYYSGLSDATQKAQVVSLNSSVLAAAGTELTDMLNGIESMKTSMRNELKPIMSQLEKNCANKRNQMLASGSSSYSSIVGDYLSTLEGSTADIKNVQSKVTGTIYPTFSSVISSTGTDLTSAANTITNTNSAFTTLKNNIKGEFDGLKSSVDSKYNALEPSLSSPSIDDVEKRLKNSASMMNKDQTL